MTIKYILALNLDLINESWLIHNHKNVLRKFLNYYFNIQQVKNPDKRLGHPIILPRKYSIHLKSFLKDNINLEILENDDKQKDILPLIKISLIKQK